MELKIRIVIDTLNYEIKFVAKDSLFEGRKVQIKVKFRS